MNHLYRYWPLLLFPILVLAEPVLANKFETIGGGVTGSFRMKKQFVQSALLYGGVGFLVAAVMAVVVPHTNASFLNYANWKTSAIVLATIGATLLIFRSLY